MNVLYLSPEVVPFSKSGGLGDVAGALPEALAQLGCQVTVATPFYGELLKNRFATKLVDGPQVTVLVGRISYPLSVRTLAKPLGSVRYLFLENAALYNRPGLYGDPATGRGYEDNDARFAFFCRGILEWIKGAAARPDIIHLNDWQSAPVAAYLATAYANDHFFVGTGTVLTVHNLAYQGQFPPERFEVLGLDRHLSHPMSAFEFRGKINFLKSGLAYARKINTVSPTYAREIQTDEKLGCGLAGLLRHRKSDLTGILNGMDYTAWDPATDQLIATTYNSKRVRSGKRANKKVLCERAGLPKERWDRPLVGIVSRLAVQKGFDLIAESAGRLFALDLNLVLLGTGDPRFHDLFTRLGKRYADRLRAFLSFDNTLAHQIEAGADMFLMPSRYEPCGLNQMYSLAYGTVPVVRATGGLADTVIDADADPDRGTGFVFTPYTAEAMLAALRRALAAYTQRERWAAIRRRGMALDFSWSNSAAKYLELYEDAIRLN